MPDPVYMDYACLGPPTSRTVGRVQEIIEQVVRKDTPASEKSVHLWRVWEDVRQQVARLIRAEASSIALTANTSHGLALVAGSFPFSPGENILIADLEFPGLVTVWRPVGEELGLEIRPVKSIGGRVPAEAFARRIDGRTRLIVVSSVQEVTGYRVDLDALYELALKHGAYLIVDGIQEVGARPVDLGKHPVDAYCAGGHKWLRCPFGTGFLHVGPRLRDRLRPRSVGYFALAEPEAGWSRYLESPQRTAFDPLSIVPEAMRLETGGSPNWLGGAALAESISQLLEPGTDHVWARIQRLTGKLRAGLEKLGFVVVASETQGDEGHQSGIVCFAHPDGQNATRRLFARLTEAHILVSLRYSTGVGGIRVSPHWDNPEEDVDHLLSVAGAFGVPPKNTK